MRGSDKPLLVISGGQVSDNQYEQIRAATQRFRIERATDDRTFAALLPDAEVVAGNVPRSLFASATRLRWIHSWAAGIDGGLYPELASSDVTLTCSKGNGGIPLAEHVILLMLMLARNVPNVLKAQQEHRWAHAPHAELTGQTLGIIGLGHSGSDLAAKAKPFHMRILGLRRSDTPDPNVDAMYGPDRLHDFLAASAWVAVTCPLTPETRHMLGEAEFRAMRRTAYYINISRGAVADPEALLRALKEGWIAGAGLDAHAHEPLPPESPFWDAPNTIVTPHNGATSPLTRQRAIDIFLDNVRRYDQDEPLRNVVDKVAGY